MIYSEDEHGNLIDLFSHKVVKDLYGPDQCLGIEKQYGNANEKNEMLKKDFFGITNSQGFSSLEHNSRNERQPKKPKSKNSRISKMILKDFIL
jgi:hypothetical protein